MPIRNLNIVQVGVTGINPQIALIDTDDTESEVLVAGYLNQQQQAGAGLTERTMCLVSTKLTPNASAAQLGWYDVTYDGASRDWSLGATSSPGNVVLPTIANHIAVFDDTNGTITDDVATAINGGNLQAGLNGTSGYLASFPATLAKGSLRVVAVANTGDTLTTLSNVAMGQASVVSIPDPANAVGHLLVGATATPFVSGNFPVASGTSGLMVDSGKSAAALPSFTSPTIANHIAVFTNTTGNLGEDAATAINGGNLQAGLSGTAGLVSSFPSAAASGSLILAAVTNASGNFNTTISNAAAVLQSQVVSIPDVGAATGNFVVSNSLLGQAVTTTMNSATPNNNALSVAMNNTVATITSGLNSGNAGSLQFVSASGGILTGATGQIISNGTLSGSSITVGLYGSLTLTGGTVNGGQIAAIYGILAGVSPTQTSMVNTHGIMFTNATAAVLNSQIFLNGDASYGLQITGATTYVATPGGSTPSGNLRTIKVSIGGADYFILAAAVYS